MRRRSPCIQYPGNRFARVLVGAALLLTAGCAAAAEPGELLLAGPTTNIMVSIPRGWHQVVNSANPIIPEMVTPTTCLGPNEIGCAAGLARIGTVRTGSIEKAVQAVGAVVTARRGVTDVATLGQGPARIGERDGFRHTFSFRDSTALVTAEVVAVASGPITPDARGNTEYSVIMVWIRDKLDGPEPGVIDQIVNSTLVHGGLPTP